MFPEIHESVKTKPTKDEENKIELSILNVNTIFSKLNKGNKPQELTFLTGGDELLNEALKRLGHLNTSNRAF